MTIKSYCLAGCPKLDVAEANLGYRKTMFALTRFPQIFKEILEVKVEVPSQNYKLLKKMAAFSWRFSSKIR